MAPVGAMLGKLYSGGKIMNWMRSEGVVWEEMDNGVLLVCSSTGSRWMLNETAAVVWKLCNGGASTRALAGAVSRSVDELTMFCERFRKLGLLQSTTSFAGMKHGGIVTQYLQNRPEFTTLNLGVGPRRRPTPRGVSGPG